MTRIQEEYPLRNGCATTSDWIGQVIGGVIYAYDLGTQFTGISDTRNMVHETVHKYKNRFREAWEELSDR